jgi:hypothetical protein
LSKFSIDDNHFPKKVKKLIESLGGENNIECVKNNNVYVKNPNLVDILKLDCDIHENVVNVNADELNMLKDYF